MSKQGGFSAVELLITLFVAAGFLVAAYQLYNVILSDGGATHQRASIANVAYDYLRQYEANAPHICAANTPLENSPITIEGLGDAHVTVEYSCPIDNDSSVTKVEVAIEYGDTLVSYATYALQDSTIPDGLIAWWPLNNSEQSWVGSAHGVASNVTPVEGQNGTQNGAYQFNGTSSNILVDRTNIPFPDDVITVSAWMKVSNVTSPSQRVVSNTELGGVALALSESGCSGQLGFIIHISGAYSRACTTLDSSLNNTWVFVAGVYDGSSAKLYVNGEVKSSVAASGNITYGPYSPPFCIGAESDSSNCNSAYLNGTVDDVRIYNKALSPAGISQLYDNGAM